VGLSTVGELEGDAVGANVGELEGEVTGDAVGVDVTG